MVMKNKILSDLKEHHSIVQDIISDEALVSKIHEITKKIVESYKTGGKLVLFGNGGSASDAQHISGELVNKFKIDRPMLNSIALNVNTTILTSIANDISYDEIFARQVEHLVDYKDIIIGLTTSGNSRNVIKGLITAKNKGALTVAFTGKSGGKVKDVADIVVNVPSENVQRIQEMHITVGHIICEIVENELFGKNKLS